MTFQPPARRSGLNLRLFNMKSPEKKFTKPRQPMEEPSERLDNNQRQPVPRTPDYENKSVRDIQIIGSGYLCLSPDEKLVT